MTKIKNYKKFTESVDINKLKYYIFDWDENLLYMSTKLHFQHFENGKWVNKDITSDEFANIRKPYPNNYMDNNEWKGDKYTFIEFRDVGPRGNNAFLEDTIKSIKSKNFGPSWDTLLKCIIEGRLFSIVTTRGHEPETIRNVIKYIIENVLSKDDYDLMLKNIQLFNNLFNIKTNDILDQYLKSCYFMGITSQAFAIEFNYNPVEKNINISKQDAINKFTTWVRTFAKRTNIPLSVGFSDDDINYSNAAKELFMSMEKSLDFPENFYVYDTSNKTIQGGIEIKI